MTILSQEQLPFMEIELCTALSRFFSFSTHSLYFPDEADAKLMYLPEEHKLFLPVRSGDKIIGMILFNNVPRSIKNLLPFLEEITSLCLELIITRKSLALDEHTGLANEHNFYQFMEKIAHEALNFDNEQIVSSNYNLHKLCMGFIILSWPGLAQENHDLNLTLRQSLFNRCGPVLDSILPENSIAAALGYHEGRFEYGVITPAASSGSCKKLALNFLSALQKVVFNHPDTGKVILPDLFAGCAVYPQDMKGDELRLPVQEQTKRLRNRARLAVYQAQLNKSPDLQTKIVCFDSILKGSGKILSITEDGKLTVSLGKTANACEGMRFQTVRKGVATGQIVLLETGNFESAAEILVTGDFGQTPEPGDSLVWLSLDEAYEHNLINETIHWLSHAEFFKAFSAKKDNLFVLGICKTPNKEKRQLLSTLIEESQTLSSELMPALFGLYGASSLIFYHSRQNEDKAIEFYANITELSQKNAIETVCGLFEYPFLNFGKQESESCALKALEYAALLPAPHIGVFDSVALNISADKKSSMGDTFGAIKEYELAIMADKGNAIAWNSLGVALAALGKDAEASRNFDEALKYCADAALRAKIYYNSGVLQQKSGEYRSARTCFKKCIENDPKHAYAWLRLGQLDERSGRKKEARENFTKAMELADANIEVCNAARRQLARLETDRHNIAKARSILHDSLLANPEDAITLCALAKLYLINNEDPDIAEMLANKSLNLGGGAEALAIINQARQAKNKK